MPAGPACRRGLAALGDLRGQGDLQFASTMTRPRQMPLSTTFRGRLSHGRIDNARLPHAFTDIAATVRVDNGGYTITDLSARSGQATLRMACRAVGLRAG